MLTRRRLIGSGIGAGLAAAGLPHAAPATLQPYEKGGALPADQVRSIVGASHGRIEAVRELLDENSGLANACWDWGGGDFETALGAASHTGRREIALLLLEHGARLDIFAAAMLGMVGAVRSGLEAHPPARFTLGPHAIPLLRHALAGGDGAGEVVAYLRGLRAQEGPRPERDLPLTARERAWYEASYGNADGSETHRVRADGACLLWADANGKESTLRNLGNHEFVTPEEGGPVLTFDFRMGHAQSLRIDLAGEQRVLERIN